MQVVWHNSSDIRDLYIIWVFRFTGTFFLDAVSTTEVIRRKLILRTLMKREADHRFHNNMLLVGLLFHINRPHSLFIAFL